MKNWKTTLGGILAATGLFLTTNSNPVVHLTGTIMAAVGTFLAGAAGADASNLK